MGWAKFDDQFTDHPKVVAAGPMAELLAMRAVIYCAKHETDGHILEAQLPRLAVGIPSVKRQVAALVSAGLWTVDESGAGWWVHDFLDYHPSREMKEQEREEARERMRKARESRSGNVRANKTRTEPELREKSAGSSDNPVPSRPVPKAAAVSDGFAEFLQKRAAAEAERRKFEGVKVKHTGGLIHYLTTEATEFIDESKRVWAHRDCEGCDGKGFTESYSPGGGMGKVECTREA
jgi:hypothetical protein